MSGSTIITFCFFYPIVCYTLCHVRLCSPNILFLLSHCLLYFISCQAPQSKHFISFIPLCAILYVMSGSAVFLLSYCAILCHIRLQSPNISFVLSQCLLYFMSSQAPQSKHFVSFNPLCATLYVI